MVRELRRRIGGEDDNGVLVVRPIAGEGWTTGRGGDGGRRARRARTGRRLPLRAFEALHSSMLGMSTGAIGSPHSRRFLLSARLG